MGRIGAYLLVRDDTTTCWLADRVAAGPASGCVDGDLAGATCLSAVRDCLSSAKASPEASCITRVAAGDQCICPDPLLPAPPVMDQWHAGPTSCGVGLLVISSDQWLAVAVGLHRAA